MTPQEHQELDEDVWIALGYGNLWFPPGMPLSGPGWSASVLPSSLFGPDVNDWLKLKEYPPVSQDWNLAMWALARCAEQRDRAGHIRDVTALFSLVCEGQRWSAAINGHFAPAGAGGPAAVCRAILKYRGFV